MVVLVFVGQVDAFGLVVHVFHILPLEVGRVIRIGQMNHFHKVVQLARVHQACLHRQRVMTDRYDFVQLMRGTNACGFFAEFVEIEFLRAIGVDKRQTARIVMVVSCKHEVGVLQYAAESEIDKRVLSAYSGGMYGVVHHHYDEAIAGILYGLSEPSIDHGVIAYVLQSVGVDGNKAQLGKIHKVGGSFEAYRTVLGLGEEVVP